MNDNTAVNVARVIRLVREGIIRCDIASELLAGCGTYYSPTEVAAIAADPGASWALARLANA